MGALATNGGADLGNSCVVHQDVDSTGDCHRLLDECSYVIRLGHITCRDRNSFSKKFGKLPQTIGSPGSDDDVGTGTMQDLSEAPAEP